MLAPKDVAEAVELTQLAFHLADKWRNPVLVFGDYYLAHLQEAVDRGPIDFGPLPAKDWALDGEQRLGRGQASSRRSSPTKRDDAGSDLYGDYLADGRAPRAAMASGVDAARRDRPLDDAELVVVAFGTPGRYVALRRVEAAGRGRAGRASSGRSPCGRSRRDAVADGRRGSPGGRRLRDQRRPDDRRRPPGRPGRAPVSFIGGVSFDELRFRDRPGPRRRAILRRRRVRALDGRATEGRPRDSHPHHPDATGRRPAGHHGRRLHAVADAARRAPPLPGLRPPGGLRGLVEMIEELGLDQSGDRRGRHRLLHQILRQPTSTCSRPCTAGPRRWRPGSSGSSPTRIVFTLQGDGDMANEGLHEVLHAAARGENDHLHHAQQRRVRGHRRSDDGDHGGRPADQDQPRGPRPGHPRLPDPDRRPDRPSSTVPPTWPGGRSTTPAPSPRPRCSGGRSSSRWKGAGFTFVEILTMCPTGWFIPTAAGPDYLTGIFEKTFPVRQIKAAGDDEF